MWYNDYIIDQFLSEFETSFCGEDVIACLKYCAGKQCVSDAVHSYCEQCTLDMEWGQQMAAENEKALRDGLPPPNEPQEDYWEFAGELLDTLANPNTG